MKVFLDSDVLLDFLTGRDFQLEEIKTIIGKGINKEIQLLTSSLIIANIFYFVTKIENSKKAKSKIEKLLSFIKVVNVGEQEILDAIKSKFKDFEDAIQNYSAINSKLDLIVTRNVKDFKLSILPILTPKEFVVKIKK